MFLLLVVFALARPRGSLLRGSAVVAALTGNVECLPLRWQADWSGAGRLAGVFVLSVCIFCTHSVIFVGFFAVCFCTASDNWAADGSSKL